MTINEVIRNHLCVDLSEVCPLAVYRVPDNEPTIVTQPWDAIKGFGQL